MKKLAEPLRSSVNKSYIKIEFENSSASVNQKILREITRAKLILMAEIVEQAHVKRGKLRRFMCASAGLVHSVQPDQRLCCWLFR